MSHESSHVDQHAGEEAADSTRTGDAARDEADAAKNGDIRIKPQPPKPNAEAKARKMFAEAQERFAAMDFAGAEQRLRMIPPARRTADVERLNAIVRERLKEIADLQAEIRRDAEKKRWKKVRPKLDRLLDLQPGDVWANELRHEIEEDEWQTAHPVPPGNEPVPLPDPDVADVETEAPPIEEVDAPTAPLIVDPPAIRRHRKDDDIDRPTEPLTIEPLPETPAPDPAAPAARDEADEQLEEIWEFGERLDRKPPPVPRPREPVFLDEPDEDDIDLVGSESTSTGVWIAVMVSSLVVLVAVVTTIVVLANYAD